MKKMESIRNWKQKNRIEIDEVDYDGDRCAYEISVNGNHVITIYSDSPSETENIRDNLNAGEDVRDWEDGNGNCVGTLLAERTTDLRETLKRLEDEGMCYTDEIYPGIYGTVWDDEIHDIYYGFVTVDELYLYVDDLTDEDLKNIIIGGL